MKNKGFVVAILTMLLAVSAICFTATKAGAAWYDGEYVPYEDAGYSLIYNIEEDGITILGMKDGGYGYGYGELVIPGEIDGITVTAIGYEAFMKNNFVGQLVIPEGVKTIGENAFYECDGFTGELVLPESLETIGVRAFYGCTCFTGDLVIPEGVKTIEEGAFGHCTGLNGSLLLSDTVTTIGRNAFYENTGLTGDLVIPKGVKTIGDAAFASCKGLDGKLVLSEGITSIGTNAFMFCSGLTGELVLPDSLTELGAGAFWSCKGLNGELVLPSGIKEIGSGTFFLCNGLTGDLVIPDGVTAIGNNAFSNCYGFNGKLVLPDSLISIGENAFAYCNLTGELVIPEGVTTIGKGAFRSCSRLTGEWNIPEGVTEIDEEAFYMCGGLSGTLVIPNGITAIGAKSFDYCTGMDTVVLGEGIQSVAEDAFDYCQNLTELYFRGDAVTDVAFLRKNDSDIVVYYPVNKAGWAEVVEANPDIHWQAYNEEEPDASNPEGEEPEESTPVEREQVAAFVERMYTVALGREAEEEGAAWWTEELLAGNSDGAGLAQGFLAGDEFANKGYSNEEYVAVLYDTFFNREIAEGEGDFWVNALNSGTTRESVLSGFVNSEEFFALCADYGILRGVMQESGVAVNAGIGKFAERLYTEVLGRAGEEGGMEYWAGAIAKAECTPKDAAMNFFTSDEYLAKNTTDEEYLEALYRTFMGRDSDEGGMSFWLNSMAAGTDDRTSALESFAASEEFVQIMASYGL